MRAKPRDNSVKNLLKAYMIIKPVTGEYVPTWLTIAHYGDAIIARMVPDIAVFFYGFKDYMERKIKQHEAFMAFDTISNKCLGIIAFSKNNNRITFLGVNKTANYASVGKKLIEFALDKLDKSREITVNVLDTNNGIFQKERALYKSFGFTATDDKIMENGVPAIKMSKEPAT